MGTHPIFESDFDCLTEQKIMAVSSLSRDYRKINIEQYADDFYVDDEPNNSMKGPDETAVQSAINGGQAQNALILALENNPAASDNQSLKDKSAELVLRALQSHKSNQIEATIKALSIEQRDTLMQYIYKGFSMGKDGQTCASLLSWHAKLTALAGNGDIIRVLTNRD